VIGAPIKEWAPQFEIWNSASRMNNFGVPALAGCPPLSHRSRVAKLHYVLRDPPLTNVAVGQSDKARRQCQKLIPRFLRAIVTLGDTLHSWSEEIARMWRFTRSNGLPRTSTTKWKPSAGKLLLDASGNQTSFINTGRYVPTHICFDRNHAIWSIGWQRDQTSNEMPDRQEYFIVSKFSRNGREVGAYLHRASAFMGGVSQNRDLGGAMLDMNRGPERFYFSSLSCQINCRRMS
jgi:hypothetical protein